MKKLRQELFSLRSYIPIPFLLVMLIFAQPTTITMGLGLIVMIIGELIRFSGVAFAGSLTRVTGNVGAPEVIVSGPFAHVRNPLYVGNLFIYIGIGIMANALFPWLLLVAAVWFSFQYYQIVMLEEEFLEKEFGESYLEFKKNVPRFIPRIVAYISPAQLGQRPKWNEALKSERRTFQALILVFGVLLVRWYLR